MTLNCPPFTNVYNSRFAVSGGRQLHLAAPSYSMAPDWRASASLFTADGTGSLMDLSAMKSITVYGGHWDVRYYTVAVNNGAVIDLSSLETIVGADPGNYAGDDWLSFSAATTGIMKFGDASVTRRTQFGVTGQDSRMEFKGLYLRPLSTLSAGTRGLVDIKGDFHYENTDVNSIVIEGADLQMDGAQPQILEVGGKNLGPTGASTRNFGYSQLVVGNTNGQSSVVQLQDQFNNGNRGASGESEAIYLYGLDGQGLRLLNNSRLIVGNIPVYAMMGGQMRALSTLLAGANSAAFDGGFIASAGGPKITNMAPSVAITPPISSVDVTFDQPIKVSTFTTADVVITGPSGAIVPLSVMPVAGNTYRITFANQTLDGTYTVKVGPDVDEQAANLSGMDQNGNGLGGEATDAFTGTFSLDGQPPVILAAMVLQNGTRVGVTFNEPVSPAFATNVANYLVNGIAPTKAVQLTNGYQVALWVSPMIGESFELTVTGASDPLGNTANRTFTGSILPMEMRDLGNPGTDPREPGSSLTFNGIDFEVVAGGSYIWYSNDYGQFSFERRDGDFDVRVQITGVSALNPEFGLMFRETLAQNSRAVYGFYENNNYFYTGYRSSPGAGMGGPNNGGVSWPGWVRLQRQGNDFTIYRGTNGMDWTLVTTFQTTFGSSGYLGLATSSQNNGAGQTSTVQYRNYSDISPSITSQPQSQAVATGSNVVFAVTARGLPVLSYQWLFNGSPISGANTNLLLLPAVTTGQVGDYRVVITNNYGSVTSLVAALVVDGVGGGGFEGDVAPTPYGNNTVTVSDWVRVGRLVAGIDSPLSSSDFQRTDCAPRTNALLGTLPLGDGRLSVADWTQAGRYAASLDPLTPAGGPNQAGSGKVHASSDLAAQSDTGGARWVRVVGAKAAPGQTFPVLVSFQGQGDENAIGFSVEFDPARLAYQGATLAREAADAFMQINTNSAGRGQLGIVIAKSAQQTFASGEKGLVELRFTALADDGASAISLVNAPVTCEVASVTADVRKADFLGGEVQLVKAPRLAPTIQLMGGQTTLSLQGEAGQTYDIWFSTNLVDWQLLCPAVMPPNGSLVITDGKAVQLKQGFYRALPQP
jgi:hypothetical protein